MANLVGQQLGQYKLTALLGEGGMAAVYRAERLTLKSEVAVKVIKPGLITADKMGEFVRRFEREAETIAKLSHPHILKLFDYGRQEDQIYLVMEIIPGGSLADLIKRRPLALPEAARLLDHIAEALDYAHDQGIIHRDLKPQNVLLDARGNAILTDFGIAKLLNDTSGLTQSGMAMGTPSYMAPEQWQSHALDARADVYALGVMLFEILTGRLPYHGDTPLQMMYAHINEKPLPARESRADLPESVERVIVKALAKRPEDRFQSAGDMAAAFRIAITGVIPPGLEAVEFPGDRTAPTPVGGIPRVQSHDSPKPQQGSGRGLLVLGGIALIALVIAVILLVGRTGQSGPEASTIIPTVSAVAANPTMAPSLIMSPTITPTFTDTPTETATATSAVTDTEVPTATFSLSPTASPNQETLIAFILATETQRSVDIIASYTLTPSLTPSETPDQISTARAAANQTLTAVVVASYTHTFTPTYTLTPTFTFTPSATPTATFTPTHTPSSTFTPTSTLTPTLTLTPTAIPAGASNTLWTPVEQVINGVPMMLVPAGCFVMGNQNSTNERPDHEVCFDQPFWIDKTEVTQVQFKRLAGIAVRESNFTGDNLPVEQIKWAEAKAFCEKRNARLPTEAEWEYAARGPQSLEYPWGSEFAADNVSYYANSGSRTAEVGSRPSGASWVGALDMAGNVWEWVNDWYAETYSINPKINPQGPASGSSRVVRGGSWEPDGSSTRVFRSAYRGWWSPTGYNSRTGFRCVVPTAPSVSLAPTPDVFAGAAATVIPAGTANTFWTPIERDFSGAAMVYVPAGCFMMGSTEQQIADMSANYSDNFKDEGPIHEVCLPKPFWIDKTEVSQALFKQLGGKVSLSPRFIGGTLPVEQINWFEAREFCQTRGGRLPTEAEWEYAARGPASAEFPWGNVWSWENLVYDFSSGGQTASVGSRPGGASWVGALDMSGNVWEWVNSLYWSYPYQADDGREQDTGKANTSDFLRVIRGGSWYSHPKDILPRSRDRNLPGDSSSIIGFRCVRDVDDTASSTGAEAAPAVPATATVAGAVIKIPTNPPAQAPTAAATATATMTSMSASLPTNPPATATVAGAVIKIPTNPPAAATSAPSSTSKLSAKIISIKPQGWEMHLVIDVTLNVPSMPGDGIIYLQALMADNSYVTRFLDPANRAGSLTMSNGTTKRFTVVGGCGDFSANKKASKLTVAYGIQSGGLSDGNQNAPLVIPINVTCTGQ